MLVDNSEPQIDYGPSDLLLLGHLELQERPDTAEHPDIAAHVLQLIVELSAESHLGAERPEQLLILQLPQRALLGRLHVQLEGLAVRGQSLIKFCDVVLRMVMMVILVRTALRGASLPSLGHGGDLFFYDGYQIVQVLVVLKDTPQLARCRGA